MIRDRRKQNNQEDVKILKTWKPNTQIKVANIWNISFTVNDSPYVSSQISVNKVLGMWLYTHHSVTTMWPYQAILVSEGSKIIKESTNWNKQGLSYPTGNKITLLLYTHLKVFLNVEDSQHNIWAVNCECKD